MDGPVFFHGNTPPAPGSEDSQYTGGSSLYATASTLLLLDQTSIMVVMSKEREIEIYKKQRHEFIMRMFFVLPMRLLQILRRGIAVCARLKQYIFKKNLLVNTSVIQSSNPRAKY